MNHRIATFLSLFLGMATAIYSIELYTTTAEVIQGAPHVASVMVDEGALEGGVLSYKLIVTEDFKGLLPERIQVKVPVLAELGTTRTPESSGSQWLVILGDPVNGVYPLRSISWGKIPIFLDDNGERRLARNLTGFGDNSFRGKSLTLEEFRQATRSYRVKPSK